MSGNSRYWQFASIIVLLAVQARAGTLPATKVSEVDRSATARFESRGLSPTAASLASGQELLAATSSQYGGSVASPSQSGSDTVLHRSASDRARAIRAERTGLIVNEGPNDLPARPLRELSGARLEGDVINEGPNPTPGVSLLELVAARVEGDVINEGPSSR